METNAQTLITREALSASTPATCATPATPRHWAAVEEVLERHYHNPDLQAARVLYAAVAAHGLKGQPVWPMAVAPPGSMKSELITALDGMPDVLLVDAVTPKTFLSGQIPDDKTPTTRAASLLHRIGKSGVILIPDFSTVQSMKSDERAAVYAALRKIFDGKLTKEFGTAEKVEAWEGRITIVVGTTPHIDKLRAVTQALGERFVMVRWQRAGIDAARKAIVQDQERAHSDLKEAVRNLLCNLPAGDVSISSEWRERIVCLAEIAVRGRTHVEREADSKDLIDEPQAESATRLAQQLCQLAKGSARIGGRREVTSEDFAIAKRCAFDCIPPRRAAILRSLSDGHSAHRDTSTSRLDIQDLRDLGLIESEARLTEDCATWFRCISESPARTQTPPRPNQEVNPQVGGTFRAAQQKGAK